ncbi:hypothetical protein [Streptomyces sp. NPDC051921]|uniref:hypothetical protein n=1 Tax=Streptomyces sp. NPDC051921 TaxID=3155806 RepID=UPI0034238056
MAQALAVTPPERAPVVVGALVDAAGTALRVIGGSVPALGALVVAKSLPARGGSVPAFGALVVAESLPARRRLRP